MKFSRFSPLFLLFAVVIFKPDTIKAQDTLAGARSSSDSAFIMKDGIYVGTSRAKYIYEPYWGKVRLTIKNGRFTDIFFSIRDSNLHEYFDGKYEKHFEGNPEYIQQSRNDWKGVQAYPVKLSDKQDINKLDAISGATWSYNIFKASVKEALKHPK